LLGSRLDQEVLVLLGSGGQLDELLFLGFRNSWVVQKLVDVAVQEHGAELHHLLLSELGLLLLQGLALFSLLLKQLSSLEEPLGLGGGRLGKGLGNATDVGVVLALEELLLVELDVLLVHLPHFLDFVQVHHEAALVSVGFLDALATKDSQVVGAVEVLHALVVAVAEQALNTLLVFEVHVSQNRVSLHHLVQHVKVERQLVHAIHLLHQLAANWAAHSVAVVQFLKALGAERVSAVHQDSWNALAHVEFFSAEVTEVEAASLVVPLDDVLRLAEGLLVFDPLEVLFPLLAQ
jgi:hypothetical protein